MMNLPFPNNRLGNWAINGANSATGMGPAPAAVSKAKALPMAGSESNNSQKLKQLSLSEFLQPLAAALSQQQPWVDDFGSDQIMLPADLYEVIKTFSRLQNQGPGNISDPFKADTSGETDTDLNTD